MIQAAALHSSGRKRKLIVFASLVVIAVLLIGYLVVRGGGTSANDSPARSVPVQADVVEQISQLPFAVSQPERIPVGFLRTIVKIVESQATQTGCDEVVQLHALTDEELTDDMTDEEFLDQLKSQSEYGYLDIYTYSPDCSYPRPDDAEPFQAGDYPGWISDSDAEESVLIEITVNQAIVRIETDLHRKEVQPILEHFVPFNATPPKSTLRLVVQ